MVAALGALLAVLALPIAGAELARRPAEPVVAELRAGAAVEPGALARLAAASRAALAWRPDGPGRATLGLVDLVRARRADRPVPHLEAAAAYLRASLRRRPADPHTWARLARTRYRLGLPARDVAAALRRSLATGAYLPRLAPARAALALRLWPVLNRDGRWRRELAEGWRRQPNLLTRTARATGRSGVLGRAVTHGSAARRRVR
ncbi:hypothetical protein [Limimonas halophila]|uniref:hypothetical protein n=1 Tax=Limimonas halophila TaxID=1082479 RepID=UPI000B7EE916|nr:hypothetical protein [Limimonas halophila]